MPLSRRAPLPAVPDRAARLRANAVACLAGTEESNARPEAAARLAAIDATAAGRLAALDAAGPGELFAGLPLGESDTNLMRSFQYLYEIALATRAPGAREGGLTGDAEAQHRVADGLAWLYGTHYGDQAAGYYGNWFSWEIGISTHVSRLLVLLGDRIEARHPGLTGAYVAAMDAYLRHGKDGDVDLDSRFHTGANLAGITTNRMLQGAVRGDDARVAKAIADQDTVLGVIDPYRPRHGVTDGFYADGSFVQHGSVAYTGSYGAALLSRVVSALGLLAGTGYLDEAGLARLAAAAYGWLARSFAPVIFEGWMMEIVRGRAVSRTSDGYDATAPVVEAAVDLAAHAAPAEARRLRAYVRHLHRTSPAAPDGSGFVSPLSAVRYADILADESVPGADLCPPEAHAAFSAMDKTVHRRPGYAFAVARSSERISGYEYMNGENLLPWFQGDGAHYLYLAGEDQRTVFGVDYLTTVAPGRLAGVTAPEERRLTVPELYGGFFYDDPAEGFTASSGKQNAYVYVPRGTQAFSGGARLGAYGMAGHVRADDAAYAAKRAGLLPDGFTAYRNCRATTSWFLLDEEIVVLTSGIGDPDGRPVTTTLDTRVADPADDVSLTGRRRDGGRWTGPGAAPLAWLRYRNATRGTACGYVLLRAPRLTAALETVTRSRRVVRAANPDTAVTRRVFTLTAAHGTAGAGNGGAGRGGPRLAYALLPHATERRLAAYAAAPPVTVLANTPRLAAVRHHGLGLTGVNAFAAGTHRAGPVTLDGPASALLRTGRDGTVTVAVCDPTTRRDAVSLTLGGLPPREVVAADEGVAVSFRGGVTRLRAATRHAYGRSFTAVLR
ncbi:polysaccharide lyase family 8 super-sandwich domain-containing protein [Streptomyces sp. 7-21]|uniref:polysaccharide lyase family 8 super-sandwich domain-containing protein n=1 Tax=Streptomyces sp. 7-21 TaxID=2802283 RepID=UPI0035A99874